MTFSTRNVVSPAARIHVRINYMFSSHGVGNTSFQTKLGPAPVSRIAITIVNASSVAEIVVKTQ